MLLNDGKALFRSGRTKSEDGVSSASYLCLYPGFCSGWEEFRVSLMVLVGVSQSVVVVFKFQYVVPVSCV
jgi:hypothetical protein